jgi:NitT/TauT family transport system ATP-binding protein
MDKSLVYESVTIKYVSSSGESLVAVDDLSLSLASGSFVAVVGPSGCGKSTLLKATAGLMDCSSGDITVGGAPVDGGDRPPGVVFQNPRLLPWLTVQGNVELGLEGMGVAKRTRAERARKELSRVSLTDFAQAFPGQLSGGMQQRVNLARWMR